MVTLLYSGNLGFRQDLGTVLRAVTQINSDIALSVLVVSSGKGLPEVRELVSALVLKNVEFRDPVPLHQLPDLLAEGDIHVICQKLGTEGLLVPSKIYGTLAAGRPSIFVGPKRCEVATILDDSGSGLIVEPGDVAAAVDALKTLASSSVLRRQMGERAKRYYDEHFGRKRGVTRIVDILNRAATKPLSSLTPSGEAKTVEDA